ncbi:energy-coupling factor transporter transmembrane component T family protein [Ligilactobacillus araffinosus]|nr:energy-coupling factor transporter transmembrane component T [Ligilactobacillus araffinosus]
MKLTTNPRLNPTIAVLLMLILGLILTFTAKIWLNIIVFVGCLLYLLACRVSFKKMGIALLIAFPFALGSWLSFISFSHSYTRAWLYATRIYTYFSLGALVTLCYSLKTVLLSLHQHFRLSNTFVYGILTAVGMIQNVKAQIKKIRIAANMHNQTLNWWNPMLYLKIIVSCLNWSDNLAVAMTLQGFSNDYPRTETYHDSISIFQWGLLILLALVCGGLAFF